MSAFSGSLDANVLLRILLNDVAEQHYAASKLLQGASRPFLIADTAIIEVIFVLGRNYEFTRSAISEVIAGLLTLPEVNCNKVIFQNALTTFVQYPALSFEDCYLAANAELSRALPLWTFDKKLAKQSKGARLISTVTD